MERQKVNEKPLLKYLIDQFLRCEDKRVAHKIDYKLEEILFISFCGTLVGCKSYQEIADFAEMKINWLRQYLPFKNGIPSHDTIGRSIGMLDNKQLEKVLIEVCQHEIQLPDGAVINIDGKYMSRSATIKEQQTKKSKGGKTAKGMVNAYCSELNSCLASISISDKSHEKKGLTEILELLHLSNCVLTLDAAYCYQETVEEILKEDAHYVIGLKGNQKNLHSLTIDLFNKKEKAKIHEDPIKEGHGRIEQRKCKVLLIKDLSSIEKEKYGTIISGWKGLKALIKIESYRKIKSKNKASNEVRYYISSLELNPKTANEIVRKHWHVENNLHWVLDVVLGEDLSTKREKNAALNFSILRKLAFNKLKRFVDPKVSMNRKMRKCLMDEDYFSRVMVES